MGAVNPPVGRRSRVGGALMFLILNPFRDRELRPLRLIDEERVALVAFLRSLSGTVSDGG